VGRWIQHPKPIRRRRRLRSRRRGDQCRNQTHWARKLRKFKKEWKGIDQPTVDKFLPGLKKYRLAD